MTSLRDLWRRGPVYRYFADLEPIDRATALVILALLFAFVVSYAMLLSHRMIPVPA